MDGESFRILLVEDNAADVYLFKKALEEAQLQFELMVIQDGGEALAFVWREGKYAERAVPDLAVLDLNLPKDSGIQILRAIRESGDLKEVRVAIVSSSAAPQDLAKTQGLGIELYITKPPDLEDFLQIGHILKETLTGSRTRPGRI